MDSIEDLMNFENNSDINHRVDTIIKEKKDAIESCCAIYVSLFSPIGAIYIIFGAIFSNFLIYTVGFFLLFWGTISYSIMSIRNKIKRNKISKLIDSLP